MTNYTNLSYLVGEPVSIRKPVNNKKDKDYYIEPEAVTVLDEHPNTLTLEFQYRGGNYRRTVSKASMYCGDVHITYRGRALIGKEVINK